MNALFYSIANDKTEMENFLKLTGQSFSLQDDYKIYMEHSLSQFGTPDAVIVDSKYVFFIEAKVCANNHKWTLETELEDFEKYKNGNADENGLFVQLYWKTLLQHIDADGGAQDTLVSRTRKIGSNEVVTDFFKKIKDKTPYYIGIIPTSKTLVGLAPDKRSDLEESFGNNYKKLFLISWEKIDDSFSDKEPCSDFAKTMKYNRNQIYIKEENNKN